MVTQKDVHNNIVVNASVWQKRYLSLRDFAYICDFLKSEQETDEDSFKKISSERKNDDGQSCV